MNNFSNASTVTYVLEEMFEKLNERFFDNELAKPHIIVGVLHYLQHSRYCNDVYRMPDGKLVDEITIDGDIIAYDKTNIVVRELLLCMIKQYAFHNAKNVNEKNIMSRGGSYYNNRFRMLAESHGLIVAKDGKYGYRVIGISDETIDLIEKNKWMLALNRYTYVHGNKSIANRHDYLYVCNKCGCSMHATKSNGRFLHFDCGGILEISKINGKYV